MSTCVRTEDEQVAGAMLSAYLPDDLMVDILTRLPLSSLLRFKRVCKTWYSLLTTNQNFISMHLYQSRVSDKACVLLIRHFIKPNNNNYSCVFSLLYYSLETGYVIKRIDLDHLSFMRHMDLTHLQIVSQCNGLVCLSNRDTHRIHPPRVFLWNPSFNGAFNFKALPVSHRPQAPPGFKSSDYWTIGFGYDPKTNVYKVVRIWSFFGMDGDGRPCVNIVEVYRVGEDGWTEIDATLPIPIEPNAVWSPLYTKGKCYWEVYYFEQHTLMSHTLVSFDFSDELFKVTELPNTRILEVHKRWRNVVLLNDSIAVILYPLKDDHSRYFEVWLMNEDSTCGGQMSWTFSRTMEMPRSKMWPVAIIGNGDLVLHDVNYDVHLYNSVTGALENIAGEWYGSDQLAVYGESLFCFQ